MYKYNYYLVVLTCTSNLLIEKYNIRAKSKNRFCDAAIKKIRDVKTDMIKIFGQKENRAYVIGFENIEELIDTAKRKQ